MIEIFGAQWCGPCRDAKALCEAKRVPHVFKDVDDPSVAEEMDRRAPGFRTLPQIFHAGKPVGGFDDLKRYLRGQS